jgi:hypothetical protein
VHQDVVLEGDYSAGAWDISFGEYDAFDNYSLDGFLNGMVKQGRA